MTHNRVCGRSLTFLVYLQKFSDSDPLYSWISRFPQLALEADHNYFLHEQPNDLPLRKVTFCYRRACQWFSMPRQWTFLSHIFPAIRDNWRPCFVSSHNQVDIVHFGPKCNCSNQLRRWSSQKSYRSHDKLEYIFAENCPSAIYQLNVFCSRFLGSSLTSASDPSPIHKLMKQESIKIWKHFTIKLNLHQVE